VKKNYRFTSDVPSAPSHNAVGGPASQLPKRTPLSEEEIEAIMVCLMFTDAEIQSMCCMVSSMKKGILSNACV
jgi:hypothetical protein